VPSRPIDCKKVMLVDDDADVRESVTEVLEDEGYTLATARNGREAIELLRSPASTTMPCLILLDLMMPVMNGLEFRREQMRDAELASIPVLVFSADGNADGKASALRVAGCLRKPVRLDEVLDAIARHCVGA